jgi:hypothetical protein
MFLTRACYHGICFSRPAQTKKDSNNANATAQPSSESPKPFFLVTVALLSEDLLKAQGSFHE